MNIVAEYWPFVAILMWVCGFILGYQFAKR